MSAAAFELPRDFDPNPLQLPHISFTTQMGGPNRNGVLPLALEPHLTQYLGITSLGVRRICGTCRKSFGTSNRAASSGPVDSSVTSISFVTCSSFCVDSSGMERVGRWTSLVQ